MKEVGESLVGRLQAGDEAAFVELVRSYRPAMLRVARSLVVSHAVAEEVVQDTWLAVVRGIERFEGRSTLKTWLFRILVNRARSAAAREPRAESLDEAGGVLADRFGPDGGWLVPPEPWAELAEDRVAAEQLARRVLVCLEHLPPSQRQVVVLRDVEGLAGREVCAVLGLGEANMRVLLHRGRARVRGMLDPDLGSA